MEKNNIVNFLLSRKPSHIVAITTVMATIFSILTVNPFFYIMQGSLNLPVLLFTIFMPMLMAPPLLLFMINISHKMEEYKQALENEIEASNEKDILLIEQERFAFIGEMFANIAHQWRQPLNTINLTILSTKVAHMSGPNALDDSITKAFDTIEDNTHFLSNTIDDFRAFFQKHQLTNTIAINDVLKEIDSIMRAEIEKERIEYRINFENQHEGLLFFSSSISQVLLNLINNAIDSFPPTSEKKIIMISMRYYAEYATITVCDNGCGIEDTIKGDIFDPYFTTKEKSQGTGLGLYMSRQIIEKVFNGTIVVEDNNRFEEGGTCFIITLPYSEHCYVEAT